MSPQQQPVHRPPPSQPSSNKTLLIVLIAVFALVLVGIIVGLLIFFLGGDGSDEGATETETSESEDEGEGKSENEGEESNEDDDTDNGPDNEDDEGDSAAVGEPDGDDLFDDDFRERMQTRADNLRQSQQNMTDLLEEAGIETYELAGYFKGIDDTIYIWENNLDRFGLLTAEEITAWEGELAASSETFENTESECQSLHIANSADWWGCFKDAANRSGQELTLIHKRYGLLD